MNHVKKLNKYRLLCIFILRIAIDWQYFKLICPRFLVGFVDFRNLTSWLASWGVLVLFSIMLEKSVLDKPYGVSSIVLLILFLVSFVPFSTCIYAGMVSQGFAVYNMIYWATIIFAYYIANKVSDKTIISYRVANVLKNIAFAGLGILSLLLIIYVSWKYAHFRLIFNLMNVYEIREEASSYEYSTLISYSLSWTVAINPILLGVCVLKKRWLASFTCIVVQMLSFGIDGRKSTFFMPFIILFILMLFKSDDWRELKLLILYGISAFCLLGVIEYVCLNSTYIVDFGIRRIFIIPNQLGEFYYDYFTSHVPDYFRSSFLRHFGFQSPYTGHGLRGFTYIIGERYLDSPDDNCVNGLASDAIANMGMIGCVVMPLLLVCFFKLLDNKANNVDKRLQVIIAAYISYNLLSTSLTTCLLTHGFIIVLVILPLIGDSKKKARTVTKEYDFKSLSVKFENTIKSI